jgi:hypothetical protein
MGVESSEQNIHNCPHMSTIKRKRLNKFQGIISIIKNSRERR